MAGSQLRGGGPAEPPRAVGGPGRSGLSTAYSTPFPNQLLLRAPPPLRELAAGCSAAPLPRAV